MKTKLDAYQDSVDRFRRLETTRGCNWQFLNEYGLFESWQIKIGDRFETCVVQFYQNGSGYQVFVPEELLKQSVPDQAHQEDDVVEIFRKDYRDSGGLCHILYRHGEGDDFSVWSTDDPDDESYGCSVRGTFMNVMLELMSSLNPTLFPNPRIELYQNGGVQLYDLETEREWDLIAPKGEFCETKNKIS